MLPEKEAEEVRQFGEDLKAFIDEIIDAAINEDIVKLRNCIKDMSDAMDNLGMPDLFTLTLDDTVEYLDDLVEDDFGEEQDDDEGD